MCRYLYNIAMHALIHLALHTNRFGRAWLGTCFILYCQLPVPAPSIYPLPPLSPLSPLSPSSLPPLPRGFMHFLLLLSCSLL